MWRNMNMVISREGTQPISSNQEHIFKQDAHQPFFVVKCFKQASRELPLPFTSSIPSEILSARLIREKRTMNIMNKFLLTKKQIKNTDAVTIAGSSSIDLSYPESTSFDDKEIEFIPLSQNVVKNTLSFDTVPELPHPRRRKNNGLKVAMWKSKKRDKRRFTDKSGFLELCRLAYVDMQSQTMHEIIGLSEARTLAIWVYQLRFSGKYQITEDRIDTSRVIDLSPEDELSFNHQFNLLCEHQVDIHFNLKLDNFMEWAKEIFDLHPQRVEVGFFGDWNEDGIRYSAEASTVTSYDSDINCPLLLC
jgi:hypothetical protein